MNRTLFTIAAPGLVIAALGAQQPPTAVPQQPPTTASQQRPTAAPQQPSEVTTTISSGEVGTPPRFAVPDFIALSKDSETVDAAKTWTT
jgi:hypothetical protein